MEWKTARHRISEMDHHLQRPAANIPHAVVSVSAAGGVGGRRGARWFGISFQPDHHKRWLARVSRHPTRTTHAGPFVSRGRLRPDVSRCLYRRLVYADFLAALVSRTGPQPR